MPRFLAVLLLTISPLGMIYLADLTARIPFLCHPAALIVAGFTFFLLIFLFFLRSGKTILPDRPRHRS